MDECDFILVSFLFCFRYLNLHKNCLVIHVEYVHNTDNRRQDISEFCSLLATFVRSFVHSFIRALLNDVLFSPPRSTLLVYILCQKRMIIMNIQEISKAWTLNFQILIEVDSQLLHDFKVIEERLKNKLGNENLRQMSNSVLHWKNWKPSLILTFA